MAYGGGVLREFSINMLYSYIKILKKIKRHSVVYVNWDID
jgi:hypothetical protein